MRYSLRREYLTQNQFDRLKNLGTWQIASEPKTHKTKTNLTVYCRRDARDIFYYAVGSKIDIQEMLDSIK